MTKRAKKKRIPKSKREEIENRLKKNIKKFVEPGCGECNIIPPKEPKKNERRKTLNRKFATKAQPKLERVDSRKRRWQKKLHGAISQRTAVPWKKNEKKEH
jgi:hypothetical protein